MRIVSSLLFGFMLLTANANAQDVAIAAIVGDDVITTLDLEQRTQVTLALTHLPDTETTRAEIAPQLLKALIDETLKMAEATRNRVDVTPEEIGKAIAMIEQQNNMPPGALETMFKQRGLPLESFHAQMKAQIAWLKLLNKKALSRIRVSDEEIEQAAQQKEEEKPTGVGEPKQVKIVSLMLPVTKAAEEPKAKALAEKIAERVQAGQNFQTIASQFTGGGETTSLWIETNQLDPRLRNALKDVKVGAITAPVRTASGYQILLLEDARYDAAAMPAATPETPKNYKLAQIFLPLPASAARNDIDARYQEATRIAASAERCESFISEAEKIAPQPKADLGVKALSDLHPKIAGLLAPLAKGQKTKPFRTPDGVRMLMVCDVIAPKKTLTREEKEKIRAAIVQTKMGLEAQKYIRSLRRDAFIEIRL